MWCMPEERLRDKVVYSLLIQFQSFFVSIRASVAFRCWIPGRILYVQPVYAKCRRRHELELKCWQRGKGSTRQKDSTKCFIAHVSQNCSFL